MLEIEWKTLLGGKSTKAPHNKAYQGMASETTEPKPTVEPNKNLFTKDQMELLYKKFGKTLNLSNTSNYSSFSQTGNTIAALQLLMFLVTLNLGSSIQGL